MSNVLSTDELDSLEEAASKLDFFEAIGFLRAKTGYDYYCCSLWCEFLIDKFPSSKLARSVR